MPVTCARCGAQNPDGNLYCQNCGNPLLVGPAAAPPPPEPPGPPQAVPGPPQAVPGPPPYAAPPGPPPGMPPPVAGPAGYTSPYYTPAAPTAPVHRTPWTLIVAGVVALVVLMAGFGTALAILGSRPTASVGGGVGVQDLPSPTPATSPSPVASPTLVTYGNSTESNDGLTVSVPSGWAVSSQDSETIVLTDPNSEGEVTIASGASSPAQTAQDNKTTIDNALKSKYPDTRSCPGSTTTATTFNGAKGISWTLCLTLTDGVHSVPAAASVFAGANHGGSVYYAVIVVTRADNLATYLTETKPILATVHWKLS